MNNDMVPTLFLVAGLICVVSLLVGIRLTENSISEIGCVSACERRAEMMLAQEADTCTCTNTVLRSDYGRMWSE